MPQLTADVLDVTQQPDNQQWVFASYLRQENGTIITQKAVRVSPVNGTLSVHVAPGPTIVIFGEHRWHIEVPEEDAPLWPLIATSVAVPPDTSADLLAEAVEGYLDLHPPSANWNALEDVPDEFPPTDHTHAAADITDFTDELAAYLTANPPTAGAVSWTNVTGKPTTFTPAAHTHDIDEVDGLEDALDEKAGAEHEHVIADITGLQDELDSKLDQTAVDARVAAGVADIVGTAPEALDTLTELADALGGDPNFATTVASQIGAKADKARTITAGTGLTGGGDLTADRTLSVSFGTSSSTACVGNDSRLSDTRTPTDGSVTNAKVASNAAIALSKLATGYVAGSDNSGARTLTIWVGTEAQYAAIGTKDSNTIYLRTA